MHFMYDIVNATLPRLVAVSMFFLEQDLGGRPVYPAFARETSGSARIVELRWARALGLVQLMSSASHNTL